MSIYLCLPFEEFLFFIHSERGQLTYVLKLRSIISHALYKLKFDLLSKYQI